MSRILYLHGFASGPGSKKARFFRDRFAALGLQMEIPDLAAGDFERLTISGQLDVVTRAAAGQPVRLIGSSLGGYLAALYAARHPETAQVVLLAPAFGFLHRWRQRLGEQGFADWQRTGFLEVFHYGEQRPCRVSFDLIRDGEAYEEYPAVQQPCLIFHGEHDDVVPVDASRAFAQDRPNVELHVMDSDHELISVLEPMWLRTSEFLTQSGR